MPPSKEEEQRDGEAATAEEPFPPRSNFDKTTWWQRVTYSFVNPIVRLGMTKTLELEDLDHVSRDDRASKLTNDLEKAWQAEVRRNPKDPSLWRALFYCHQRPFVSANISYLADTIVLMIKPIVLRQIVVWIEGKMSFSSKEWEIATGWGLIFLLSFLGFLQGFIHHIAYFTTMRAGWRLRTATIGLLQKKILRLSSQWQAQASTGQIVSIVANDAQRYDEFAVGVPFLWIAPFSAIVGVLLIVMYVGWPAALAGCCGTVGLMPIQMLCGREVGRTRRRTAQLTDKRVKIFAEILSGIQTVKAFVWEDPFRKAVTAIRAKERQSIAWAMLMKAITMSILFFSPSLGSFVTFVVYWALGNTLDLPTVFAVVSLLQVLRETARWIPRSIEVTAEANVATCRIRTILMLPEVEDVAGLRKNKKEGEEDEASGGLPRSGGVERRNKSDSNDVPMPLSSSSLLELEDVDFSWFGKAALQAENEQQQQSQTEKITMQQPTNAGGPTEVGQDSKADGDMIVMPMLPVRRDSSGAKADRKIHVRGVTLNVKPGELVVVCGTVGSGKTTLLDGILGEAACIKGRLSIKEGTSIAYCSQEPWIQIGTIKDNILFGRANLLDQPMDSARYDLAVERCALAHDLEALPEGDMTEIGELGVNLSGGQRARVALCRAVYADADLYLLDDVLSAVDAHVSKHLFHKCIRGTLREKAVVLVTHQVQYLPYADRVCLIDREGHMVDCAPWETLKSRVPDWKHMVETAEKTRKKSIDDKENMVQEENEQEEEEEESADEEEEEEDSGDVDQVKKLRDTDGERRQSSVFVQAEERVVGAVKGSTYLTYLVNGGWIFGTFIMLLMFVSQANIMLADFLLKYWATSDEQSANRYPKVYALIMGTCIFLAFLRAHLFFVFSLRASTRLHDNAVEAVLASPLSFFFSNPQGRILNKFSRDLDGADDLLPNTLFDFLQSGMLCLGGVVVGCMAIPYLVLIVAPLGYFFYRYRREFVCTAREVKRLDSITRSPIYADAGTTLAGAKVIRAFKAEEAIHRRFLGFLDDNGKCYFCFLIISRHLGFRLDNLCAYFMASLCILAVALRDSLDQGMIALSLTYALSLSGMFQWAIRQSAQSETLLTSIERLHYYTTLPSEGIRHNLNYPPPSHWPSKGEMKVNDLHVRYREDLPVVLKDVTFSIPGGKKVGVVGRTGSGKSSFLQSLLRLNEIVSGDIMIDGVSLTRLGLADSRCAISWIPQVPNLFAGTLRFNLDPFSRYSDAEIRSALKDVQLKGLSSNLEMAISEGGGNISVGQRQLLSLARAVLSRRKILLMDEATANVDYITDSQIQTTLTSAPAFQGCTIIVIAHRIRTILDSDIVLVFSDGKLAEQGSPAELLANKKSIFAGMVNEAGGASTS